MRGPGRLVLLGHPVAHSLSPVFQNAALRSAGLPVVYDALDVPPEELDETLRALARSGSAGNVTVPHKQRAAAVCDRLTALASRVGAVNTFWCDPDGALVGDNTDVDGFDAAVRHLLGAAPDGLTVALVGSGGAAAAVLAAVETWNGARARLWGRTAGRAAALAKRYAPIAAVSERIEDALRGADLVVNATPVGLQGGDTPFPPALLPSGAAVLDLAYRRGGETPLVAAARMRGLRASDGMVMLVEQGALAFERWFGVQPDREAMWASLR